MTIVIRSYYLDIVTAILLNDVRLCAGEEMAAIGPSELEVQQETDVKYAQWANWVSDSIGCGLITGGDIVRL